MGRVSENLVQLKSYTRNVGGYPIGKQSAEGQTCYWCPQVVAGETETVHLSISLQSLVKPRRKP